MKILIRLAKLESENNKDATEPEVPRKLRVTIAMIVKSWIVDSREDRRAAVSQLQSYIRWKALGGLARG